MVVAGEVKQSVNHQKNQFVLQGDFPFQGVPRRGIDGNDDIPQNPVRRFLRASLVHGKGQDIGRPVPSEKAGVQIPDLAVAGEDHRHFPVFEVEGTEDFSEVPTERP